MRYPVRIFDLDGTLVDSAPSICRSMRAACRELGLPEPEDAVVRPMIGLSLAHIARTLVGAEADEAVVARLCDCYRTYFDAVELSKTVAFSDVPELLARWQADGRRLAIATSKSTPVARKVLAQARLLDHFELVVGGDQVVRGKPAPDMALNVLAQLGVEPPQAALIGDAAHDVTMARAAGVEAFGVSYGVHDRAELEAAGARAVVDRFADLATFLD